ASVARVAVAETDAGVGRRVAGRRGRAVAREPALDTSVERPIATPVRSRTIGVDQTRNAVSGEAIAMEGREPTLRVVGTAGDDRVVDCAVRGGVDRRVRR